MWGFVKIVLTNRRGRITNARVGIRPYLTVNSSVFTKKKFCQDVVRYFHVPCCIVDHEIYQSSMCVVRAGVLARYILVEILVDMNICISATSAVTSSLWKGSQPHSLN